MPKLCLPHVALTLRQQHKRFCWYFFVFYDCLPQLFRHRYWWRCSAACGCNFGRETRTVKLWLPTVEVTRTATGWRCCCCLYGFCPSFILEGGLAAVPIAVAVAAASQLTLANGNGVNVATVAAATVPATTPATTAATATVAATAAANERELNLGDLTLSIYLGHGCCLLSCVRCSGAAGQREGGLFEPAEMYW